MPILAQVLLVLLWRHRVSTLICPHRQNSANSVYKYTDAHTHIYIYAYIGIYIHIYIYLQIWQSVLFFSSGRHECSTLPPNVGAFGSDTPHCWLFVRNWSYEIVPMDRGIIVCFRPKVGFDFVFTSQIQLLFEKTHISMLIVYLQRSFIMSFGKGSHFLRKAPIF